eukprot:m.148689 g.148689  ORF g.148689 m.148689 type:complete len:103 (+) comp15060_c2_seq2:35-343(+)
MGDAPLCDLGGRNAVEILDLTTNVINHVGQLDGGRRIAPVREEIAPHCSSEHAVVAKKPLALIDTHIDSLSLTLFLSVSLFPCLCCASCGSLPYSFLFFSAA